MGPERWQSGWQTGDLADIKRGGLGSATQPTSPSQIVQMGTPAAHTPHTCIWKMLPCTGLLEGFGDMVLGANSTSSSQLPPNLVQFTFILFYFKVVLEIRFRATFHHVQHPSILPLSKFPITLSPPFFRLLVFQLTTYFPGSYLYLAKCPGKTAPPTETMSASLTKSLESQEEGGRVRTFARPAPPGRWTGPGNGNNTAQGRFGTVRQNSSLRVLGK